MNIKSISFILLLIHFTEAQKRLLVSVAPLATFTEELLPLEEFKVDFLVPSTSSPESWQMRPSDRKKLTQSQVYIQSGFSFEKKIADFVNKEGFSVIEFHTNLSKESGHHEHHHEAHDHENSEIMLDPHVWTSPEQLIEISKILEDEFIKRFKEFEELIRQRGVLQRKNLMEWQRELKVKSSTIHKAVLFYHPSHNYLCEELSLECLSVEKEGKIATGKNLSYLIQKIKEDKISVMWVSPQSSQNMAKSFAQKMNVQIKVINPLAQDYRQELVHFVEKVAE